MPGPGTRIANAIGGWIYRHGPASVEQARRVSEERRETLRMLREQLTESMARADEDRRHGTEGARDAAVMAAFQADGLAALVDDEELRSRVAAWSQAFEAIKAGSELHGGPGQLRWAQLDEAYRDAIECLGQLYREALRS